MNPELKHILAQQRTAELHGVAERARLASELPNGGTTGFKLHGHHLARLDRFLGQANRVASQAEREFEGVSIEIDAHGVISVHAIGMTPMVL
jgi:hypothetical protein